MKLWNRVIRVKPETLSEGNASLIDAHEYINSVSDYNYALWETVIGTLGEFGVSALCPDIESFYSGSLIHPEMDAETMQKKAEAVNMCVDSLPEDSLWNIIHTVGDWSNVPNIVANVINTIHVEQVAENLESTIEFVDYMHQLSGTPVTVSTSFWGTGPAIRLIWGYESLTDFDERTTKGMTDTGFHERNAKNAERFGAPVRTQSNVMKRLT